MKNLKEIRKSRGQTQLSLAMKIGVQQETISAYENGKAFPTIENLIKLCNIYNCSSDYLLDLTSISIPVKNIVNNQLTMEEIEIINKYRNMNIINKNKLLGFLEAIS